MEIEMHLLLRLMQIVHRIVRMVHLQSNLGRLLESEVNHSPLTAHRQTKLDNLDLKTAIHRKHLITHQMDSVKRQVKVLTLIESLQILMDHRHLKLINADNLQELQDLITLLHRIKIMSKLQLVTLLVPMLTHKILNRDIRRVHQLRKIRDIIHLVMISRV